MNELILVFYESGLRERGYGIGWGVGGVGGWGEREDLEGWIKGPMSIIHHLYCVLVQTVPASWHRREPPRSCPSR